MEFWYGSGLGTYYTSLHRVTVFVFILYIEEQASFSVEVWISRVLSELQAESHKSGSSKFQIPPAASSVPGTEFGCVHRDQANTGLRVVRSIWLWYLYNFYNSLWFYEHPEHHQTSNHVKPYGHLSHPKRHGIAHRCNSSSAAWRIKRRGRQCLCLLCQWSPPLALSHGFVLFFWATMMNCPLQEVLAFEE